MNNTKKGFVLLFALTILTLMGLAMLILTQGSRAMYVESQDAWGKLQAANLALSATAWAKENIKTIKVDMSKEVIQLDTSDIANVKSKMAVAIDNPSNKQPKVTITASVGRGAREYKINNTYLIFDLMSVPN